MEDIIIVSQEDEKKRQRKNITSETPSAVSWGFVDTLNSYLAGMGKVKAKEKVVMYRLLATMINAGMPITKAIWVLIKQEKNPTLLKILNDVSYKLRSGLNLSDCLEDHHKSFSAAEIGIIRSGEKTGQLNTVMNSLAEQVEKVASISWKLKSALIYPVLIIVVVILVIAVMMIKVVPGLIEIFDDPTQLPSSTQALINISNAFTNYWHYMILGVIVFVFIVKYWKTTPSWKYNFDNMMLHLPVFWEIVKKVILSKFSRVFAGLMASWVSVVESLKIVSDAVGNEVYRQKILLVLEDVRQWLKIHESLEGDVLFPNIMVQMIEVGEQTANLDKTIVKVADFYDEQVDNLTAVINKTLEPFIIVVLGGVVGLIAWAIMQPIMEIAGVTENL